MVRVRAGTATDVAFLRDMLFEAPRPTLNEFERGAEAQRLLAQWGRRGDRAVIAEDEASGRKIGAAWFRLWTAEDHSYGYVSPSIPEIAMAIEPASRGHGVGRALLRALIDAARVAGFPALSLSVSPENHARQLYEDLGFVKAGESGTSWTYTLTLE